MAKFNEKIKSVSKKTWIISGVTFGVVASLSIGLGVGISQSKKNAADDYKSIAYKSVDSLDMVALNPVKLNVISFEKFAWYDLKTTPGHVSLVIPGIKTHYLFDRFNNSVLRIGDGNLKAINDETEVYDYSTEKNKIGSIKVTKMDGTDVSELTYVKNGQEVRTYDLKSGDFKFQENDLSVTVPFGVYENLRDKAYSIWESNFYQKADPNLVLDGNTDADQKIEDLTSGKPAADGTGVELYKIDSTIRGDLHDMYEKINNSRPLSEMTSEIDSLKNGMERDLGKEFADAFWNQQSVKDYFANGRGSSFIGTPTPDFEPYL